MITNYFTLRALVDEWQDLVGSRLGDAFSHHRGEVSLTFYEGESETSIVVGTTGNPLYVFRHDGYNRPKRNVVTLFEQIFDRTLIGLHIAQRDRLVRFDFGDVELLILPYGPRANVLVVDAEGNVTGALRNENALVGRVAPRAVAASDVPESLDEFERAMTAARGKTARRIRRVVPLFDDLLAHEVCHRAGIDPDNEIDSTSFTLLYDSALTVRDRLDTPSPHLYYDESWVRHFSLIELQHLSGAFEGRSVGNTTEGVRMAVRAALARRAFEADHGPLLRGLRREAEAAARSVERMLEEMSSPSRADLYERYGHLLMAHRPEASPDVEQVTVADLFDGGMVDIPLDKRLSVIENAERYYDRARTTRRAREASEARLDAALSRREQLEAALNEIADVSSLKELRAAEERHRAVVALVASQREASPEANPYRLVSFRGYDILIGRNARLNDRLTFGIANKNDLWLHARGTAGSHVIIRRNRDEVVPREVIERAASLAAWYSKARGSHLVPVMLTERKFVRKPKGALPGTVVVDREEVLMVEPEPIQSSN